MRSGSTCSLEGTYAVVGAAALSRGSAARVAASWTQKLDPMGELTVSTSRAGLQLVLRRTAVVLAVLIPVLAVAGGVSGVSPAMCLLRGLPSPSAPLLWAQ
ncbi:hypothetical protein E4K10_46945 [Streptomyces sp. T1317-0309]|nr:hypothetical protein E4K10_46945 [Streptomyces sp. T1317-0309]